jgi:hypothetical protein
MGVELSSRQLHMRRTVGTTSAEQYINSGQVISKPITAALAKFDVNEVLQLLIDTADQLYPTTLATVWHHEKAMGSINMPELIETSTYHDNDVMLTRLIRKSIAGIEQQTRSVMSHYKITIIYHDTRKTQVYITQYFLTAISICCLLTFYLLVELHKCFSQI